MKKFALLAVLFSLALTAGAQEPTERVPVPDWPDQLIDLYVTVAVTASPTPRGVRGAPADENIAACGEATAVVVVGPYDRFSIDEAAQQIVRYGLRHASIEENVLYPPNRIRLIEFKTRPY